MLNMFQKKTLNGQKEKVIEAFVFCTGGLGTWW